MSDACDVVGRRVRVAAGASSDAAFPFVLAAAVGE